ncbi:hypothetical protein HS088_TW21G01550 [Tripterygium wilfordii]|uniref:C2 NT-type domain-containing protein n=1 Tax=Tripterygium wilfordii TaxID=458696 RepID=A0A7J7C617_TRIWF|nr:uncharacterized protein LOC119989229 [Tripterygium wilfordii]KAF5729385.1 hypothetical protein HS088_TW21G01550 [Tripterygium wilfordii]
MGVMMRWPSWPTVSSRKFEVKLIIHRLEGLRMGDVNKRLVVEIKWKGQKSLAFRPSLRRNFTEEGGFGCDNVVEWNEEFRNVCNFSGFKGRSFSQWEVVFTVLHSLNQGARYKDLIVGTASLNLAEFALTAAVKELDIKVPLTVTGSTVESSPSLCLSLVLFESKTAQSPSQVMQRSIVPVPQSPSFPEALSLDKEQSSIVKAGLTKVKISKHFVSAERSNKAWPEEESSDGWTSRRSQDLGYNYQSDGYSPGDDSHSQGVSEESKEDSCLPRPVNYEMLAYSNQTGQSFYSSINSEEECWIYYSNRELKMQSLHVDNPNGSVFDQDTLRSSMRRILAWKKRKLSLKSPKAKVEPLLKKHYGEAGGDDIDFDRRQLSSSDDSGLWMSKSEDGSTTSRSSDSEFGDDNFAIGKWEYKEVTSRDGLMKLEAQVFFASIDQRSVRAAGESACTALVAVIANWLQCNPEEMPIKSEIDSLIREGSSAWRKLCDNDEYRERFPDKHFDLETVLQAKIGGALTVVHEKSFIGFFHPEGLEGEQFAFLDGAMAFDGIWEEISQYGSDCHSKNGPLVYIVSWNDHFFILKVDQDAYYIIDTLGERLFEGCNHAYVLKFDKDTTVRQLPNEKTGNDNENAGSEKMEGREVVNAEESSNAGEEEIVISGKESCKEYIKSFLAAIPIRELQADIKKGLMAAPLHHRLQIEFHYTQLSPPDAQAMASSAG